MTRTPGFYPASHPEAPPASRGETGTRGRGLTYQRKVQRVLEAAFPVDAALLRVGHWLWTGAYWLQPDFVIEPLAGQPFAGQLLLLECKLTYTPSAWVQLERYRQALCTLRLATPSQILRVQVCRNLTPSVPSPCLVDDLTLARDLSCWHLFL